MAERIVVDYRHTTVYFQTALNAVGATTSLTLRTAPAPPGAGDAYVRKYGDPYAITDVTNGQILVPRGGGPPTGRYRIYSVTTNTLLGTVTDNGASAFVDGAALAAAEDIYIVLDSTAGAYTVNNGDILRLTTDVDAVPPLDIVLSGETVTLAGGETITWYVASGGSTYYDTNYMYGGERHTPVLGSAKYPYFDVATAIAAAGAIVEILDSETYTPGPGLIYNSGANITIQSSLGQTPSFTSGVGARATRSPNAVYNNANVIFVNPAGNDANPGTWALPMLTLNAAYIARGVAGYAIVVVGGLGCVAAPVFGAQLNMTAAATTIDADWEIVPRIDADQPVRANTAVGTVYVRGIHCNNVGSAPTIFGGVTSVVASDCTMSGGSAGLATSSGANGATACEIYAATYGVQAAAGTVNCLVESCNIHDCGTGVLFTPALGNASYVARCLIWNCTNFGVRAQNDFNPAGTGITYTTIWGCTDGIYLDFAGAYNCVPFAVLIDGCTNGINITQGAGTITINFCSLQGNGTDWIGAGVVVENNAIAGDPDLIQPELGFFGVEPISPCYHLNGVGGHVGLQRLTLFVNGNGVTVDGIIFDGEMGASDAIFTTGTRTGLTVTWCTLRNYHGCAVDDYGLAATTGSVLNCLSEDCGNGFVFPRENNTITECVVYGHGFTGIYLALTGNVVTHVSTHGGKYGIYIGAGGGLSQMDNIWYGASIYSFYSAAAIFLMWSCYDSVSANVTVTDPTNVNANPFYLNTDDGLEDLQLRTIEGGYPFDSRCEDGASDGYDMGAYLIDRGVTDESWLTAVLDDVSFMFDEDITGKGVAKFETASGASHLAAKTHRRELSIRWRTDVAISEDHRYLIEYLSTLIEEDHQGVTAEQSVIRVHAKPTSLIMPVTAGLFNSANRTFYVAGAGWQRNRYRAFDLVPRWIDRNDGVIVAAARTVTCAGAAWVPDEWIGYWFPQAILDDCDEDIIGYRWFRILDNTANVLTLSDPYGVLEDVAANAQVYICSFHKVASNDGIWMNLEEDGEEYLRDETVDAFIGPIRTRLSRTGVDVNGQASWRADWTHDRIPDRLMLEESDPC